MHLSILHKYSIWNTLLITGHSGHDTIKHSKYWELSLSRRKSIIKNSHSVLTCTLVSLLAFYWTWVPFDHFGKLYQNDYCAATSIHQRLSKGKERNEINNGSFIVRFEEFLLRDCDEVTTTQLIVGSKLQIPRPEDPIDP